MSVEPPTSLANPEDGEHRERNDPVKLDESTDQRPWQILDEAQAERDGPKIAKTKWKEGTKGRRISELARLHWPRTNGRPPKSLDNDQVWRSIAAEYEKRYGRPVPDRTTILRNPTIGRYPRR